VLDSGCCGLAGSFGYASHRHELSMRIGELSVFPPIRASPEAAVVAPGTSCRHQIAHGTGAEAMHPVALAARLLLPTAGASMRRA
jgi:Fe-S oxidoreductase